MPHINDTGCAIYQVSFKCHYGIFLLIELLICGTVCLMKLCMQNLLIFKSRLDKFWSNQELIYDYHAEVQGTGSRSVNY